MGISFAGPASQLSSFAHHACLPVAPTSVFYLHVFKPNLFEFMKSRTCNSYQTSKNAFQKFQIAYRNPFNLFKPSNLWCHQGKVSHSPSLICFPSLTVGQSSEEVDTVSGSHLDSFVSLRFGISSSFTIQSHRLKLNKKFLRRWSQAWLTSCLRHMSSLVKN